MVQDLLLAVLEGIQVVVTAMEGLVESIINTIVFLAFYNLPFPCILLYNL